MANKPNIRFKDFTEDWFQKTIGEQLFEINEKNNPKQTDFVVSLTVKDGVIPYSEKGAVGNRAKEDHTQYKLTYPNTIVLNSMNILIGAIGLCNYYGCVSPIYYVYRAAENVCLSFVYRHMSSKRFQKNLRKYGNGILEIRLKVPTEDLMKRILPAPSEKEQKRIAKCFDDLDKLISQREAELEKLKNIKRALLEKLFPQNREKVPALRFKEFTEEWGEVALGSIADKVTTKNSSKAYTETFTNSAEHGIMSQSDFFDHAIANQENIAGYYIVQENDFVYNPRISKLAPVGPINRNKLGRTGVVSPLYTVFRPKNVSVEYLEVFFMQNSWNKFMNFNGNSGARLDRFSISDAIFWQMPIQYPQIEEQQKTAKLITTLSNLLSLREKQLTLLKHTKQALLEQMFVNE